MTVLVCAMENELIKILIAEDQITDVELAIRELNKGGIKFIYHHVFEKDTFLKELEEFNPDIILCDYSMPAFDGMTALRLAREKYPTIPFIIYTGSINEETAVKCMKEGANDYIIKQFKTRLPLAVKSALDQSKLLKEKLKAEEELRRSEEKYRVLSENAIDIVYRFTFSPSPKFEYVSPSIEKITGIAQTKLYEDFKIGLFLLNLDENSFNNLNDLYDKYKNSSIHKFELQSGEIIYLETKNEIVFEDKLPITIQGIARDVTQRVIAEQKLLEAKLNAEKADRLKSNFLAQISHEIRTPINVIMNFVGILKEIFLPKENEAPTFKLAVNAISKANMRIIRTIDLIINMSEIQTGSYKPNFTKIHLFSDVLERIIPDFQLELMEKELKFKVNCDLQDDTFIGDSYSITQIFINLIDNAIKFTNKGSIDMNVNCVDDKFIVEIADTGIGISEEYMKNLFKPFSQEDEGYTRKYEGNGLGLALVKRYCELNKGKIEVQSKKGEGTKFTLTFNKN